MAAITSISNGEAMSSVRTKLNSVITEINILDPIDWTDYSATSTIVGWSSFTAKIIRYRIIGKQMFIYFNISGTSNSTATTFTLPNNSINANTFFCLAVDNGATSGAGYSFATNASNLIDLRKTATGGTWTASGTKQAFGQFFIEIA